MARPDAITYEQVELACAQLKAEGIEPSVRQVVQRVGGSNTTVLEHVERWKASNPKTVAVRTDDLPIDVMGSLGVVQFRPFLGNRGEREPTVGVGGQGMS